MELARSTMRVEYCASRDGVGSVLRRPTRQLLQLVFLATASAQTPPRTCKLKFNIAALFVFMQ